MVRKRLKLNLKKALVDHWLVLVFIFVFLLRLPSLFEPFTYGDEGIYLTLGQAVKKGLILYRDIHDNKPPMLYLLAALAGSFSNFRLILFIWSLATIFAFYKLSQLFFAKNKPAMIIATSAFALLISLHTFEGNIANAENFMLLPTIAAMLLIIKKAKFKIYFLAGILFSIATLFKVPASLDFAAAFFALFLILFRKKSPLFIIHHSFFMILGFLTPILITIFYFASQGALSYYLKAAFFQNIPYLSSWTTDRPQVGGLPLPLLTRGLLILTLTLGLFIFRKKISSVIKLILVWFAFSLFAALLSARPYPHYLIQILPSLSLSFGLFFAKKKEKLIPLILAFIFLFAFLTFKFWYYPNLPYYLNFYQYALGFKDRNEYFTSFDPQALPIYQTAHYLQTHTLPEEKIFIWGTRPSIYALANRLPVGRYTVSYHIIDFNGYQKTIEALTKNPPRYLIVSGDEKRPFPDLDNFIQTHYFPEIQIGPFQLFHRIFFQL